MCISYFKHRIHVFVSFPSLAPASSSAPPPSLLPSPPPHSLSVLCYRWQSSCLWCLAGEPGPAVSACSAHGHCSLVPGGRHAPSGLPSDPQNPLFLPWWPVEDKVTKWDHVKEGIHGWYIQTCFRMSLSIGQWHRRSEQTNTTQWGHSLCTCEP